MTRCLVVDDDNEIRSTLQTYLEGFSLAVTTAANGAQMRRAMQAQSFDIVILDLMLPDENGLALCQWAQQTSGVPVIMLTAHGDPVSRVVGLEIGADDYLGKPVEPRELVARIHSVLRRGRKAADGMGNGNGDDSRPRALAFAGWRFDRELRQLNSPEDVLVPLSNAEFRLLSAFVDRPRRVLSRDQLMELTRAPGVAVNDRSIDLGVSRLRQKLGDSTKEPQLIRTLRGEGYLFDAAVQR